MGEVGKSLAFDEAAVEGLLQLRYGERNCFPLLSLIYPSNEMIRRHVDHVYPQTRFTRSKLEKLGLTQDEVSKWLAQAQETLICNC